MSLRYLAAVADNGHFTASEKLVLLCLADHADENGLSWPSVRRMHQWTSLDRKTIFRTVATMELAGCITRDRKHGQVNKYRLAMSALHSYTSTVIATSPSLGTSPQIGTTTSPQNGTTSSPQNGTLNHHIEPSIEPSVREGEIHPLGLEEDKTVWPDWYGRLWDIPGFKTPLKQAQAWLDAKGISVDRAEETAYSLKSKWPGPVKNPYRDVWATFQVWCKRQPLANQNGGTNVNGTKGTPEGIASLAKFGRIGEAARNPS